MKKPSPTLNSKAITSKTRAALLGSACSSGADYLNEHRTLKAAYARCTNPSWMCWAFTQLGLKNDPRLRDAAREIALGVFEKHFSRTDAAVAIVFQWLDSGDARLREGARAAACAADAADAAAYAAAYAAARAAADAAADAAAYAAADAAAYAADAAADAAAYAAAYATAYAAACAADAADAAAYAAARAAARAAADAAARAAADAAACDTIRKHMPWGSF